MSSIKAFALALLTMLVVPTTAGAADWEFKLAPYLWFAGLKGDVATIPGVPASPPMVRQVIASPIRSARQAQEGVLPVLADVGHLVLRRHRRTTWRGLVTGDGRTCAATMRRSPSS